MNKLTAESIDLLRRMIAVPSESFGEEAVAGLLYDTLGGWGLAPARYRNNIVCKCSTYSPGKKTLVLDAHIDTVRAASGYTRDPYDAGDDDGIIYGLGSNDDGGSVAAMIAAFRFFYGKDLPVNLVLSLSAEEERSGKEGASMLFGPEGPAEVRDADWVIIGEPTGMKAAIRERGLLVLDGIAEGVSGHAARNEGINALYIALEDIERLRKYDKERLTVTQINAGTAHNVVPDKCNFVVDIRPEGGRSNEEILEELQGLCRSRLTARNLTNRSSATYEGSPLLKTLEGMGIGTFASPTTSNWMRTGKDAIKMGPGESSRSHGADEYILCSEIEKGIEIYIDFIEKFYGNIVE